MHAVRSERLSDEIGDWLERPGAVHTVGGLVTLFGDRAFAVLFIVLLAVPALPLPTGGVTHVFELVCVLLAGELIVGREHVWLPQRLRDRPVPVDARSTRALLRMLRWVDGVSRPTWTFLFDHRLSNAIFGVLIVVASVAAFLAPPFSGLDTIPALGGLVLSCGFLAKDARLALAGVVVVAAGAVVVALVGAAAVGQLKRIF